MRAMKRTLTALTLGGFTLATGPAMAAGLSQETANFAFDDSDNIAATEQVAKLSDKEMKETKGQYGVYGALAGGAVGALGYTGAALGSENVDFNPSGFAVSTGAGALAGATGGFSASTIGQAARTAGVEGSRIFGGGLAAGHAYDALQSFHDAIMQWERNCNFAC